MSLLHESKQQKKDIDPLIRLMAPTIAGIFACVFCLVGMTWAWFTSSVNTPTQTIQVANRNTIVEIYEIDQSNGEKTPINPTLTHAEGAQANNNAVTICGGPVVLELSAEKIYEIALTGGGTATTGYCKVALSHTVNGEDEPETKLYHTANFEKENTVRFTFNTGGFSGSEGVTKTLYTEYVENTTPPTVAITSYWGKAADDGSEQISTTFSRDEMTEITLLSDGDVFGLAPIPCPEAKAETVVELEGFEMYESAEISAEQDYKVPLTLKEGYKMPSEVVVNIDGKDYAVSTKISQESDDAPYYDAETGVLTVPVALLNDGAIISVIATATPIPEKDPDEEKTADTDKKDESEDKDNADKEAESGSEDAADKKSEGDTTTPDAEDNTKSESGTDDSNRANAETTSPETNPDNTTEGNGKDEGTAETPDPNTETTTASGTEDNTDTEQGDEKSETEGNGEDSTDNGTKDTVPDTEGDGNDKTTIPTEPTTSTEPNNPAGAPESSNESASSENNGDTGENNNSDDGRADSAESTQNGASNESTTSSSPSVTPSSPTPSAPDTSETSTSNADTQASNSSSSTPAASAPSADSNSNGASQTADTTASESKETSSEK